MRCGGAAFGATTSTWPLRSTRMVIVTARAALEGARMRMLSQATLFFADMPLTIALWTIAQRRMQARSSLMRVWIS